MEVVTLSKDGRCVWLEKNVLKKLFPEIARDSRTPGKRKSYVILDWVSNDRGKVGVDIPWLRGLGVPFVKSVRDLPPGNDYDVINTGYDSIIEEEKYVRDRGLNMIDKPCPFVRKLRRHFENIDPSYQYVFLCEPNHITIKNFASIFPEDMILVQMENYAKKIEENQNGKPFRFIPYVTFLQSHIDEVYDFIQTRYGDRKNDILATSCLWATGRLSPIDEILELDDEMLEEIDDALLITTRGTTNKSVESMEGALKSRKLNVIRISSLGEYFDYERKHPENRILLVRSPIPNKAESPIFTYLETKSRLAAYKVLMRENRYYKKFIQFPKMKLRAYANHMMSSGSGEENGSGIESKEAGPRVTPSSSGEEATSSPSSSISPVEREPIRDPLMANDAVESGGEGGATRKRASTAASKKGKSSVLSPQISKKKSSGRGGSSVKKGSSKKGVQKSAKKKSSGKKSAVKSSGDGGRPTTKGAKKNSSRGGTKKRTAKRNSR